jgi:hypothetical protein
MPTYILPSTEDLHNEPAVFLEHVAVRSGVRLGSREFYTAMSRSNIAKIVLERSGKSERVDERTHRWVTYCGGDVAESVMTVWTAMRAVIHQRFW